MRSYGFAAILATLLLAAAGSPARAQGPAVAIATGTGRCLRPVSARAGAEVRTAACGDAHLFRLVHGTVRTAEGKCLDWINEGGPVHLAECRPGRRSQLWELTAGETLRNGQRPDLCMDVEGGDPGDGVRVLAWRCDGAAAAPPNQRFRVLAAGAQ